MMIQHSPNADLHEMSAPSVAEVRAVHLAIQKRAAADKISKGTRRLLAVLLHRAGDTLWTWASIEQYAAGADLTTRHVRRLLRWLEEHRYIRAQPRYGETTIYHLLDPRGHEGRTNVPHMNLETHIIPQPEEASWGGTISTPDVEPKTLDELLSVEASNTSSGMTGTFPLQEQYDDILIGPAGAIAIIGGAAYVPSAAEEWYTAMIEPLQRQTQDFVAVDLPSTESSQQLSLLETATVNSFEAPQNQDNAIEDAQLSQSRQVRRRPPSDPVLREKYYKLRGKAKKCLQEGKERQARALNFEADKLMETIQDITEEVTVS